MPQASTAIPIPTDHSTVATRPARFTWLIAGPYPGARRRTIERRACRPLAETGLRASGTVGDDGPKTLTVHIPVLPDFLAEEVDGALELFEAIHPVLDADPRVPTRPEPHALQRREDLVVIVH